MKIFWPKFFSVTSVANFFFGRRMIIAKSAKDLDKMRAVGELIADVREALRDGQTQDVDRSRGDRNRRGEDQCAHAVRVGRQRRTGSGHRVALRHIPGKHGEW